MPRKPRKKTVWNKGKTVGPKSALTPEQVQAIRTVLAEGMLRDRVMFALAIDGCLRGNDLVRLQVLDVQLAGEVREVIRLQPAKTKNQSGIVVAFEPSTDTSKLLRDFIDERELVSTDYLFTGTRGQGSAAKPMSERAYHKRVKAWIAGIGLSVENYGTHSLRRSRPAYLYKKTGNLRACQIMLGHQTISTTQRYLGIEEAETLALAREFML